MLPNGYMTRVGERGVRFSGGQIQRIAIARALYKKRSLLILDEFTSALDNNTEKDLIDVIDRLEKNIAVVIVTHRPSLLSVCSTLYEMNSNGRLIKMFKKGKSINPDV